MGCNKKATERNLVIEMLRFLFAVAVLGLHSREFLRGVPSVFDKLHIFENGALAVEFFFILTGFFMARSAEKYANSEKNLTCGRECIRFIVNKYFLIFPYHAFACAVVLCVHLASGMPLKKIVVLIFESIPNLLMMDMAGIPTKAVNGYEWFLSAMFIAILIIYPLLIKNFDFSCYALMPLIAIFGMMYMNRTKGTLRGLSIVRAAAVMALGCIAYLIFKKLSEIELTRLAAVLITALEVFIYISIFVYMCTDLPEYHYFNCALLLTTAVLITLSGKSFTSRVIRGRVWAFLGKFSLPLYINQYYANLILYKFYPDLGGTKAALLFIGLSLAAAIVCYIVINFIYRKIPKERLFIKEETERAIKVP